MTKKKPKKTPTDLSAVLLFAKHQREENIILPVAVLYFISFFVFFVIFVSVFLVFVLVFMFVRVCNTIQINLYNSNKKPTI